MKQFSGSADHVRGRFAEVRERVDEAARRAGRAGDEVEIVVATKYVAADDMGVLRDAGVTLVGENRAQDLLAKHERFADDFVFDFIGHLQSRKVKLVLPLVRLIHSVSTTSVVEELQGRAQNPVDVLLEVNIAGEESKAGIAVGEADRFLDQAAGCDKVSFSGLMCMPPLFADPELTAPYFAQARQLATDLSARWAGRYTFAQLSMGTSVDYEVAVREGATIVRVGSVLF
ncbi:MAG: YggS family pyridoxal phosphate-dependent enzyme [Thermoleophilia bacterium]